MKTLIALGVAALGMTNAANAITAEITLNDATVFGSSFDDSISFGAPGNAVTATFEVDLPSLANADFYVEGSSSLPNAIGGTYISGDITVGGYSQSLFPAQAYSHLAFETDSSGILSSLTVELVNDFGDDFWLSLSGGRYGGMGSFHGISNGEWQISTIPIPATLPLLALGFGGVVATGRRPRHPSDRQSTR